MKGHFYKPNCKCEKGKRCKCGATWSYIVDIGIDGSTGKRRQRKKGGFATKAEAETHLAQLLVDVNNQTYKDDSAVTFEAFSEHFLKLYESTGYVKKTSVYIRKNHLNEWNSRIGKIKIKDLTAKIIQDEINNLFERLSENTLKGLVTTLKMVIKKAFEHGLVKTIQTQFVFIPKKVETIETTIPKYLEKHELKRFLLHLKKTVPHQEYLAFLTLAYTGIRVGELCGLKWSDIDFDNQTISINRTYGNIGSHKDYYLNTPKTKSSKRVIHIDSELSQELQTHRQNYNIYRMSVINNFHNENFVFINQTSYPGYPMKPQTIRERMRQTMNAMGLPVSLSPHSLRHTHTSLLAEAGIGLEAIMERLGHKDDHTTRTVYLHITQEVKKDASEKFAALMKQL